MLEENEREKTMESHTKNEEQEKEQIARIFIQQHYMETVGNVALLIPTPNVATAAPPLLLIIVSINHMTSSISITYIRHVSYEHVLKSLKISMSY